MSKVKDVWEGLRGFIVGRGIRTLIEWYIKSTVKDPLVQETYLTLVEPVQSSVNILTDDDKDNSAQLRVYLLEEGNLRRITNNLITLAEKMEKEN